MGPSLVPFFDSLILLQRQAVGLGNDGNNIDNLTELLHDNNVDGTEGVTRRVDEEQGTVNTSILNMAVTLRSELLAEVRAVLVLDVLDNRVPATRHMEDASDGCGAAV